MNSGRRKRLLLLLQYDPDSHLGWFLLGGRGRHNISQRISQPDPIGDASTEERDGKSNGEVVDSGDTASWNHEAVPEHHSGHDEPEERIKVAKLHGFCSRFSDRANDIG